MRAQDGIIQRHSNMAENGSLVTVSGAALSLLLYENVRSMGDQIGFLLGEVVIYVTKNVTDSDRQVENIQTHVDINTILTYPSTNSLYNGIGHVDKEKLKSFIRDKSKHIVGWFRFRRNGSLAPTLQDKILHKELRSTLFNSDTRNHEYFTMCLLNTSVSNRGGTHKFRHVFLRYKNCDFVPIPLRINNLGDDSSRPDGSDYKPTPLHKSLSETDAFTKIIKSLNLDVVRTPGTELVTCIQKATEEHLEHLIPKLSASDREVSQLENKVRQLQTMILAKKLSSRTREREISCLENLNCQWEKNEQEREKKKLESKLSADRIRDELIDIFNDDNQAVRNHSMRQASYSNKQRNLVIQAQKSVNVNPKNFNQDGTKGKFNPDSSKPNTSRVQDPPIASVALVEIDMTENSPNKDSRSVSKESSSSPECLMFKSNEDHNDSNSAPGRGYGRNVGNRSDTFESSFGSKKARRGKPRIASQSQSPTEHEKPKVVAKLESPASSLSYSQATRKSNDANTIQSSGSQEY
ncbi:BRISC complex subunit FAM175B-like isoform X2 [Diprion similis]|uniref:BRISC complex subunit FAM175B-like isoform X2 n=1 Tax=Diprion similis TaxID=362088 RepID=UPI001EF931F9|nr:BRISC complex subunit FAM175B-like isoform X2 [Diprion similis]